MTPTRLTAALLTLLTLSAAAQQPPTASQVTTRLIQSLHITLDPDTVDTFKAGDPQTPVTGIVTTFTPTMDVLRQAVAQHKNLVITHEPSFYNHRDETTLFAHDPVYLEKLAFIQAHHLVLFRLHDSWHKRVPDGIVQGWIEKAGWQRYRQPDSGQPDQPVRFRIPPTTLAALARQLQAQFGARIFRVIGDPNLPVTLVAYAPGAGGEAKHVQQLERNDVEVLLAGEASEWETVEYVRDAMQQGRHKALILLGHDTSEETGMKTCADTLKQLFPTLPVAYIPAGEPYWLPNAPPVR